MSIALAGKSDDTFLSSRPVSISLAGIARDFGVSRVHVRRVIQEGVSAGLLERSGARADAIQRFAAPAATRSGGCSQPISIHYAHCARLAHAEIARDRAAKLDHLSVRRM